MRPSSRSIANGVAWIGIFALIGLSLGLVSVLGFPGVLILGLLTTLICVRAELSDDVPTWSRALFESRLPRSRSLEAHAADLEVRDASRSPLRYYRGCGLILIAAGLVGTAWQLWS